MHSGRLWTNIDDAGQVRSHKYRLRNHAFAVHMLCEHPNLKKASTPLENHHDCNCYYDISFILIFTFYVSVLIKRYFDFVIVTYTQNMKQIIWMQNGSFCLWMISTHTGSVEHFVTKYLVWHWYRNFVWMWSTRMDVLDISRDLSDRKELVAAECGWQPWSMGGQHTFCHNQNLWIGQSNRNCCCYMLKSCILQLMELQQDVRWK